MPKTAAFMIFILVAAERQICQKMRQIYDFQFQWQEGGSRSVRRVGRRLTPLALPVPYTPHLGIDSIKTGPKNGINLCGVQKWTQSKQGPKRASIKTGPKFSQNLKRPKNCLNQNSLIMTEGPQKCCNLNRALIFRLNCPKISLISFSQESLLLSRVLVKKTCQITICLCPMQLVLGFITYSDLTVHCRINFYQSFSKKLLDMAP